MTNLALRIGTYTYPADDMENCNTPEKIDDLLVAVITMNNIRMTDYDKVRRFVLLHLCQRGRAELVVGWLLLHSFHSGV